MSNVSGIGKLIKSNPELLRAQRVCSCLNKIIRITQENPTEANQKRLIHWQKNYKEIL